MEELRIPYLEGNATKQEQIKVINIILKHLGIGIESSKDDRFYSYVSKFIVDFPTKTEDGRILSPAKLETVLGNKIFRKLLRITKGNADVMDKIIKALNKEVLYRKKTGKMKYMKNIETWVNNGEWENSYNSDATRNSVGVPKQKLI
jgi:hypothetical protein